MKFRKTMKRTATIVMVLSLLVGMVSVMGPFPTVDAAEQVTEDVWSFSGEWAESGFTDANKNAVDAAFNVYAGCEAAYTQVAKADLGADNDGGNAWSNSIVQLQTATKGLTMHNLVDSYSSLTMRNYMSLVPKDANGAEILVKDFEVSFKLTTQLKWSTGGFMLQFGSQGNGRAAVSANTPYNDRGAVLITADGYAIVDGAEHGENTVLYQKPYNLAGFTKFPSGYDTGNGNGTSAAMNVSIKVLNGKLTLKITKDGEETPFVDVEKDINWNQEGVVAFTGLLADNTVSDMALKKTEVRYDFTFDPDFSAVTEINDDVRDVIDAAFNVYAGCEAAYTQVAKAELGADNDGGNTWSDSVVQLQANANGLTMHNAVTSYDGKTMRNYMSLVPKNANGEEYVAKNFEVSFKLTTSMKWSNGGFMLQFGSQGNGRAAVSDNTPYAQRAAVLITSNGAAILDGAATSAVNETLYKKPTTIEGFTAFSANGTTNGTSPALKVNVKVQDGNVAVTIARADNGTVLLTLNQDITWLEAGTIAFTGFYGDNTVSEINMDVEEIVVEKPDFEFKPDFVAGAEFTDDIRNTIDAAFNVYAGCEATYTQVAKAELGADNDGGNTWSNSVVQLKTAASGLTMHSSVDSYSGMTMRNYMSLVPKDAEGNEIYAKNFEVSFKLTTQMKWSTGGFMLQFGSQGNGRAAISANTPYAERAAVLITSNGAAILDGAAVSSVNETLYKNPTNIAEISTYTGGTTNGTSPELLVNVKVQDGNVAVTIAKAADATVLLTLNQDITWLKAGTIAFTGLLMDHTISDIEMNVEEIVPEVPDFEFKPDFVAGAEFTDDIRNTIDAAFNVYAGCEAAYTQVAKAELGADNDGGNTWSDSVIQLQTSANGLTMHNAVTAYDGKTMRNYMSLVPKNVEGNEIYAKNFEVSFKLTTSMKWSNGGFMLQFGSQGNGRAAVTADTPYAQRAAVLITSNGAAILDGAVASAVNETLYRKPTTIAEFTTFSAGGTTNGTSLELLVNVTVQDGNVAVTIAKAADATVLLTLNQDITWLEAGAIAFTGLYGDNTVSDIEMNVEEAEAKQPDFVFTPDFSAAGDAFPYDFSADNAVNNGIRDAIDAAFNVYAGCGGDFGKIAKSEFGKDNDFGNTWNDSVSQMKATANGLNLYNFVNTYDGQTMRGYLSLVPKDANGYEIYAKDFEISFNLTASLKWSNGGFMLQFSSQDSGRAALAADTPYAPRAAVLITANGAMILDGAAASVVDETLYRKPQTCAAISTFKTGGATNGTSAEMKVYVKVLDGNVTVVITKTDGTEMLSLNQDITWTKEGTIALTGMLMDHAISNVELTLLEGNGQGEGEEDPTKPENTETVKALVDDGRAMTLGRVTWEGTTAKLPWALAGVRIAGNLHGKVTAKMQASSSPGSYITVVVDGDRENATTTWVETGMTTFTAVENLEEGYHTVDILRASTPGYAPTSIFNISYNGTLEMPTYGDFQMEFIGDSITGGEGNADTTDSKSTYSVQFCNSYETYAAKTARALGAEMNVLATCGWTTAQASAAFTPLGNPDIVVINLGTNVYGVSDEQLASDVKGLIAKVRAAYGEDTYIVWAYGMMYTEKLALIEAAVDEMAATDAKLFFCDLSAAQNQLGTLEHPDAQGHTDAANILVPFIRRHCGLEDVIVDTFEQGTLESVQTPVEGSDTLVQYITTVVPEGNAQLKAGSLRARVKGSTGPYNILPKRVGFRDPSNTQGVQFVFESEEELEFTADFYTPADESEANMTILGTSTIDSADKNIGKALRFVSRSYVYYNNGKFYMDINGEAKEVKDFGMYVTSRMALKALKQDSIQSAIAAGRTSYIVKRSIPEAGQAVGKLGIFYDYCDAYVDTCVQITQLTAAMLNQEIVSCSYIEFADGKIVYTNEASSTYTEG